MMLRRKHKIDHKNNRITNLSKRLPIYLKAANAQPDEWTPEGKDKEGNEKAKRIKKDDLHMI